MTAGLIPTAVLAVLAVPGCGSKPSSDLVVRGLREAASIHSAHFSMRGSFVYRRRSVGFQALGVTAGPQLSQMSIAAQSAPGSGTQPLTVVERGPQVSLLSGGGWAPAASYEAQALRLMNPALYLDALRSVRTVRLAADVKLRGRLVHRAELQLATARVSRILRRIDPDFGGFARHVQLSMEAWVGARKLRLRRLRVILRAPKLGFVYHATIRFTDLNSPVVVASPPSLHRKHAKPSHRR